MPDYKEMYLKMVRATEAAINVLIHAQQECEEMYIEAENDEEEESRSKPKKETT